MEPFYDILHGEAAPSEAVESEPAASVDEHAPVDFAAEEPVAAEPVVAEPVAAAEDVMPSVELEERGVTPAEASPPVRMPTPAVAGEIFVTETMAELYLQQGHLDSALDIYRRLLAQRPDDASLVERVRNVEEQVFGPPAEPATHSGPTIREFLNALTAGKRTHASESNGASGSGSASGEGGSRHTLPGSIDAMFPHADASTVDSTAAAALGEAFGMEISTSICPPT